MNNTVQELTQQKLAIEAELAQAIAAQTQKQDVAKVKLNEADEDLRAKYEGQLQQMEEIISEVNQAAATLEIKLQELRALHGANNARLPSGKRMRSAFVVPANYAAHDYAIPFFEKQKDRYVFAKKNLRLLR